MNKTELSKIIASRMSVSQREARLFIDTLGELLQESLLKDEYMMFQGFGTFTLWKQAERPGRNPKIGVPVVIHARNSVKFKAGKQLLEALNKKKDQLK